MFFWQIKTRFLRDKPRNNCSVSVQIEFSGYKSNSQKNLGCPLWPYTTSVAQEVAQAQCGVKYTAVRYCTVGVHCTFVLPPAEICWTCSAITSCAVTQPLRNTMGSLCSSVSRPPGTSQSLSQGQHADPQQWCSHDGTSGKVAFNSTLFLQTVWSELFHRRKRIMR